MDQADPEIPHSMFLNLYIKRFEEVNKAETDEKYSGSNPYQVILLIVVRIGLF